jgi:hypothetical protein
MAWQASLQKLCRSLKVNLPKENLSRYPAKQFLQRKPLDKFCKKNALMVK